MNQDVSAMWLYSRSLENILEQYQDLPEVEKKIQHFTKLYNTKHSVNRALQLNMVQDDKVDYALVKVVQYKHFDDRLIRYFSIFYGNKGQ